jgi:hypothetical protein
MKLLMKYLKIFESENKSIDEFWLTCVLLIIVMIWLPFW